MEKNRESFDEIMNDKTIENPVERVQKAMNVMIKESLKEMPMIQRLNFVLGNMDPNSNSLNWEMINELIEGNKDEFEYNIFDKVSSVDQVIAIRDGMISAEVFNYMPWRRFKCVECGEETVMSKSEIDFFVKKEFKLPKRCKECRSKKK